jgi:N-acetylmuramoyl-L-alanine amidase
VARTVSRRIATDRPGTAKESAGKVRVAKPRVIWTPSPNFNSREGTDIDCIVLHHTASDDGLKDLRILQSPSKSVSAHYLLDRDGGLYQLVKDADRAWHAGKCELRGVPTNMNSRSIGIEIVNRGDYKTPYTEAQYRVLEQLVPYLAQKYKVPMANLLSHEEIAVPAGRKNDPSKNFNWNRVAKAMERVSE